MAEQRGQEAHHGAGHAGHLDQKPQEHEQRHREQDEVAHALVHAPDHHHLRRCGGERDIAEGGKAEGEGDRHGGEYHRPDEAHEEDEQVEVAQRLQHGRKQDKYADNGHDQGHDRRLHAASR